MPEERQTRTDPFISDVDYGVQVPGGKTQLPVSGDQLPEHALGCTPQIGGKLRRPPTVGPAGPWITKPGDGAGVGSAWAGTAVPIAARIAKASSLMA
jgi:hypothetical protein